MPLVASRLTEDKAYLIYTGLFLSQSELHNSLSTWTSDHFSNTLWKIWLAMSCKTPDVNRVEDVAENSVELSEYMQTLLEGNGVGVRENLPYPFVKPAWLDEARVKKGQQFAKDHLFGLLFSTGISVILIYAYQTALQPIIFTRNSSSPFSAFKRYLQTVTYIKSWYEHDLLEPGSPGHQNMKSVRGMHERVKKRLQTEPAEEVKRKLTNEGGPMFTEFYEELLADFQSCPELKVPICGEKRVHVSQTDMAITQFAFMGTISCFPKYFGIHNASDEDIDAFLHLWRFLGHLLGIEDKYNLCSGDFNTVMQRNRDLLELWLKPSLRTVSRDWLHMARCMIEGIAHFAPGTNFQVHMMYLCTKVLNIPATKLKSTLGFKQWLLYYFNVFLMKFLVRVPGVFRLFNSLASKRLIEGAKNPKAEMQRLEAVVYPYEMQHRASSCPMMN